MKRINSNSWRKPFDGDIRPSQDSAYNSSQDRVHNSQCVEFSQISTQDLFGQNSQSQTEGNQKMSMYEKWLSNRSSKPTQRDATTPSWTTMGSVETGRADNKVTTPTSLSLSGNKYKADQKDEQREFFETVLNSFHENQQQIKSLVFNLQEMVGKIGVPSFNDDTKAVLSSFLEDIAKSHDNLASQFQNSEKYTAKEKEFESQQACKTQHIVNLECKLKLLEDQGKKSESDESSQNKAFREEVKSFHQNISKKLEELTEIMGCQKDTVEQCKLNVQELREDCATKSKGLLAGVRDSENRILKEMKRLPEDMKNELDVKSDMMTVFEGLPLEIEHSLKNKLQSFTKDIKNEISKENKRNNEQIFRKQFDQMRNKMDDFVSDHKALHQSVATTIQESLSHQLKGIDHHVKDMSNKSSSDSLHLQQIQKSVTSHQDELSQQLQNMILQQKEICELIKSVLKNSIESRQLPGSKCEDSHYNDKSDTVVNRSMCTTGHEKRVNDMRCEVQESNGHTKSLRSDPAPSNNLNYKVMDATKVNNTWMPVINQTNIYPPSHGKQQPHVFKSPHPSPVIKKDNRYPHMITDKSESRSSMQNHMDYFKRPAQTFCKSTPSPVAAIKPLSRPSHTTLTHSNKVMKDITINQNKSQANHNFEVKTNDEDSRKHQWQPKPGKSEEEGYWLRKRTGLYYNENGYIRETPSRNHDKRKVLGNSSVKRKWTKQPSVSAGHTGGFYNGASHGTVRQTPNPRPDYHVGDRTGGRKRQLRGINEKESPGMMTRNLSVYDFMDGDDVTPSEKFPCREVDKKGGSSASSPAMSIYDLNWIQTPSVKMKRHGVGVYHSGMLRPSCDAEDSGSILDV